MSADEFSGMTVNHYWRIVATLPFTSGLPEDVCINTWHFVGEGPTDYTLAFGWLGSVYDTIAPRLSSRLSRTADKVTYEVYDLSRPRPNPPIASATDTLVARSAGFVDLPEEVALVGSYQAVTKAGSVQSRRRGRVYFGPFAVQDGAGDHRTPSAGHITAVVTALDALVTSSKASNLCRWAVFSPTNAGGWMIPGDSGPPYLPAAVSPVDNGWVDNAWDTQRRRGIEATARTTFS